MSILSILMKSDQDEPSSAPRPDCGLCVPEKEVVIWRGAFWRLIDASEATTPGYLRLIVNRHVTELSWLAKPEREQLFSLLQVIDESMRQALKPTKINIASLGNQVPHMHWHIIPRWHDDPHFPQSIWSATQRDTVSAAQDARHQAAQGLFAKLPKLCAKAVY